MKKLFYCLKYLLCATLVAATTLPGLGESIPLGSSPRMQSVLDQAQRYDRDGNVALAVGDAIGAEAKFHQAIDTMAQINISLSRYSYDLAEALTAQGKNVEAMRVYQRSIQMPSQGDIPSTHDCIALLRYALLLNQTGQWARAVALFNAALPDFQRGGDRPKIVVFLDPMVSQPLILAATAHVALGVELSEYGDSSGIVDHQKAQSEFTKGLEMAPDWDVANYYYAFGLQQLGRNAQASAAFQKTIKMAKGDVKAAAERALKKQKKPV